MVHPCFKNALLISNYLKLIIEEKLIAKIIGKLKDFKIGSDNLFDKILAKWVFNITRN